MSRRRAGPSFSCIPPAAEGVSFLLHLSAVAGEGSRHRRPACSFFAFPRSGSFSARHIACRPSAARRYAARHFVTEAYICRFPRAPGRLFSSPSLPTPFRIAFRAMYIRIIPPPAPSRSPSSPGYIRRQLKMKNKTGARNFSRAPARRIRGIFSFSRYSSSRASARVTPLHSSTAR